MPPRNKIDGISLIMHDPISPHKTEMINALFLGLGWKRNLRRNRIMHYQRNTVNFISRRHSFTSVNFCMSLIIATFAALARNNGEMLEWLKRHAWKVCIPVKGYLGFESLSLRLLNAEVVVC